MEGVHGLKIQIQTQSSRGRRDKLKERQVCSESRMFDSATLAVEELQVVMTRSVMTSPQEWTLRWRREVKVIRDGEIETRRPPLWILKSLQS